jgi:hypothetical protein
VGGSYDVYKAAMADPWKHWWVTWPLLTRVRVGDVFGTSGGTLSTAGDLGGRSVTFSLQHGSTPADFTYDSNGSVSIRFKAAGHPPTGFSALAEMDAGALVEFGRGSSALVIYTGLVQEGFSDSGAVAAELTRLYWDGRWDESLVAVRDVISAQAGTVLVATQGNASAELHAAASAQAGPATLVDLSGSVSFARSAHLGLKWSGRRVTPFYRVVRLRKTWTGKITEDFGPRQRGRGAAPVPVPPLILVEAREDPGSVIEDVAGNEQPIQDGSSGPGAAPESGQ